ncbi:MAG: hypothetical protein WC895_04910, partial [Candidatus Shapirobacteria bacterium]
MDNGIWFVAAYTLLDFLTYCSYNWKSLSKRSPTNSDLAPNPVLWGIWTFLSTLGASSYHIASGDLLKAVLAYENVLMCVVTLIITCARGIPKKP